MRTFTSTQVVEITKMNMNTMQGYIKEGIVIPYENPQGKGQRKKFSPSNLTMIKVVSVLSKFNSNRSVIKKFAEYWAEAGPIMRVAKIKNTPNILKEASNMLNPLEDHKGRLVLKFSGDKWELGYWPLKATDIFRGNLTTLLINVTKIMEELKMEIEK